MSKFEIRIIGSYTAIDKLHKLLKYLRLLGRAGGSDTLKSVSGPFEFSFDGDGMDKISRIDIDMSPTQRETGGG